MIRCCRLGVPATLAGTLAKEHGERRAEARHNEQLQLSCPSLLRAAGRVMQARCRTAPACMTLPATLSDDGQQSCSCSLYLTSNVRSP